MVGSSPLILLNDLIENANESLPPGVQTLETFHLFDVTPVGLALLAAGILYFLLAGRFLLPQTKEKASGVPAKTKTYFADVYGIKGDVYELLVTVDSPLVGMTIADAEELEDAPILLAIRNTDEPRLAPPSDEMIWVGTILGVMGTRNIVGKFALDNQCRVQPRLRTFGGLFNASRAGISEVVIPPGSRLVGKTVGEARLRSRYGISVLAINRRGDVLTEGVRDNELETGDCLVSHSTWRDLSEVSKERDFIVATDIPKEEQRPQKVSHALVFFAISMSMIIFSDYRLSISLLVGAMGMILSGVLSMDEAYRSVSWKTVFLLASLIPLGQAMERTGTAAWIAQEIMIILGDVPELAIQAALAVLATIFSLVMSNVGATTILVPISVSIALATGASPAMYALIVALSTSNAFILPTHQVNALIMGPGGYRVADFHPRGKPHERDLYCCHAVHGQSALLEAPQIMPLLHRTAAHESPGPLAGGSARGAGALVGAFFFRLSSSSCVRSSALAWSPGWPCRYACGGCAAENVRLKLHGAEGPIGRTMSSTPTTRVVSRQG